MPQVHWKAPATMLAAFAAALALVIGHHFFYASLDGKDVPTEPYRLAGHKISRQQFDISVGTVFAFLVRTFLGIAMTAAYVQLFWNKVNEAKPHLTLNELDWANDVLRDIFAFCNFRKGARYPVLFMLAIIFWCVPIGTIFPPATISVTTTPVVNNSLTSVPQFDFASLKYAAALTDEYEDFWTWQGPSVHVTTIAQSVMGLGQILPIAAPLNSSWSLDFFAPALQCDDVSGKDRDAVFLNIWNSYYGSLDEHPYSFLSWVSPDGGALPYSITRPIATRNSTAFNFTVSGPPSSPLSIGVAASLYVAVMPDLESAVIDYGLNATPNSSTLSFTAADIDIENCNVRMTSTLNQSFECASHNGSHSRFSPSQVFDSATLLKCDLVNTSYTAQFNYSGGAQAITLHDHISTKPSLITPQNQFVGPIPGTPNSAGQVQDSTISGNVDCTYFLANAENPNDPCVFDETALRLMAYQGIAYSFFEVIVGGMVRSSANTSIMSTALAASEELAWAWSAANNAPTNDLAMGGVVSFTNPDLQSYLASSGSPAYQSLTSTLKPATRGKLKTNLEDLFQNLTISLLSDPYFQPNYSSPYAPSSLSNVTIGYPNRTIYTYNSLTLWLAYGVALLFAAAAVIAGLVVIYMDGMTYTNNFSTLVRVARTADLTIEVERKDGLGCDPLPEYLKHARMHMITVASLEEKSGRAKPEEQSLAQSTEDGQEHDANDRIL